MCRRGNSIVPLRRSKGKRGLLLHRSGGGWRQLPESICPRILRARAKSPRRLFIRVDVDRNGRRDHRERLHCEQFPLRFRPVHAPILAIPFLTRAAALAPTRKPREEIHPGNHPHTGDQRSHRRAGRPPSEVDHAMSARTVPQHCRTGVGSPKMETHRITRTSPRASGAQNQSVMQFQGLGQTWRYLERGPP